MYYGHSIACIITIEHACALIIVHACTMIIVDACTMIIVHACTMIMVHACTMVMVRVSCRTELMVGETEVGGSGGRSPPAKQGGLGGRRPSNCETRLFMCFVS